MESHFRQMAVQILIFEYWNLSKFHQRSYHFRVEVEVSSGICTQHLSMFFGKLERVIRESVHSIFSNHMMLQPAMY